MVLVLALVLAGCGLDPRGQGESRVPVPTISERPEPGAATPTSVAPAPSPTPRGQRPLTTFDVLQVYQLVLERYVDRVDHTLLLDGMARGAREELLKVGALPMDTAPLDAAPLSGTGRPDLDALSIAQALEAIEDKHADDPTWPRLPHAVLRGMMESLGDPHSVFLDPEQMRVRNESNYTGIGVRLSRPREGQPPLVVEVFDDSPAQQAGIHVGDRIVRVGEVDVSKRPTTDIIGLIRGEQGSEVTLTISRAGQEQTFTLRRAPVMVPTVMGSLIGRRIGYIRIRSFSPQVPEQVRGVAQQALQRGARAWIVDLRGNPGGMVAAVTDVAGVFIDRSLGPLGYEVDRTRRRSEVPVTGSTIGPRLPLVLLVDHDSASGAEIFAAAVRDYGIGTIVGEPTAGNVGVGEMVPLPDGSAVQLTVKRFVSPQGNQIDRVGVKPDQVVELTERDLEQNQDPQLQAAVEILVRQLSQG